MDVFFGTDTSPSSGDSSPVIIRKMVVLPAPLGPTRPTFSPGLSWNEASTNRTWRPYCLLILDREIIVRRSAYHDRLDARCQRARVHGGSVSAGFTVRGATCSVRWLGEPLLAPW